MRMSNVIDGRPGGITYVTTGQLKEDMGAIAALLDEITSGEGDLTDEQFKLVITGKLKTIEEQLDELFEGMNHLGKAMIEHGLIPRPEE